MTRILKPSREGDTTIMEWEVATPDVLKEANDILTNHQGLIGGFTAAGQGAVVKEVEEPYEKYVLWPQPAGG